jgi:hypothetical protein
MPDYKNSKVYKIYSLSNPDLCYIGSTTLILSQRLAKHKHNYKYYQEGKYGYTASYKIFDECNDYRIELLEAKECNNKEESLKLEGQWIKRLNCINKVIVGRTQTEYRQDRKEHINERVKHYRMMNKEIIAERNKYYRLNNIQKLTEKKKQYYDKNKELLSQKGQQYRYNNQEIIKERRKIYRENNKEKIKATKSKLYNCECGRTIQVNSKGEHFKSKFHIDNINGDPLEFIKCLF